MKNPVPEGVIIPLLKFLLITLAVATPFIVACIMVFKVALFGMMAIDRMENESWGYWWRGSRMKCLLNCVAVIGMIVVLLTICFLFLYVVTRWTPEWRAWIGDLPPD